jgi:hypothetical protein
LVLYTTIWITTSNNSMLQANNSPLHVVT